MAVNLADRYVTRTQTVEVERWVNTTGVQMTRPIQAAVIKPGVQGYLLEIPKIGVRAVVKELHKIRSQPNTRRLAILACSPPFSARERLIVYAVQAGERTSGTRGP